MFKPSLCLGNRRPGFSCAARNTMSKELKEQAIEFDSKLRTLRRQVTTFAIGYREENAAKQHPVRAALTASRDELSECAANCDSFIEQTQTLQKLLAECDKDADEIYDCIIELYHSQGVAIPEIDCSTIPVGFPVENFVPPSCSSDESERSESFAEEESITQERSESPLEELVSEIYISRPPGEAGVAPETPMIKTRKRLFANDKNKEETVSTDPRTDT